MFIKLFNETLEMLGGDSTIENVLTALARVNINFINQIDWDNVDSFDDEFVNEVTEFVYYFLENYGEETADIRELSFNGECGIIEFTELTVAKNVKDEILFRANTSMTKKQEFDIEKLKKKLESLTEKYDDIIVEMYGNFAMNEDIVNMTTAFELTEVDDEVVDFLKVGLYSENAAFFIQCGDEVDTMTVYGIMFENKHWRIMHPEELEEYMDENWVEEQKEYGYENVEFDTFEEKF